jgi:hypothetical protein
VTLYLSIHLALMMPWEANNTTVTGQNPAALSLTSTPLRCPACHLQHSSSHRYNMIMSQLSLSPAAKGLGRAHPCTRMEILGLLMGQRTVMR